MTHNFTASDIVGTSIVFVLFPLVLVIPGYVLGALLNLFAFDRRTLLARLAISICLSISVIPIATYLCWWSLPSAPWLLCAVCWVALPVILLKKGFQPTPRPGPLSRQRVIVLAILAGWVAVGTFCLIDIQVGHRLYFPVSAFDYTLRAAVTSAVDRTGVPPVNPYFYPGHPYILRYHYFWYMLCGLVGRFGGPLVTARIAVIGGTLWSGIGLVALVALYVRFFRSKRPENPDKQMVVALALLSVTGLDIIPLVIIFALAHRFYASSQWWNEPVSSWVNSVFWQPHSVAALIACATGFLILRNASGNPERRTRLCGAVVGGVAFASAMGLSVYVTFVFGVFLMVWVAILLLRGRRSQASATLVAGALGIMLSVPYLFQLFGPQSDGNKTPMGYRSNAPIEFRIRSFYIAREMVGETGSGNSWKLPLVYALSLPLNYFLEFGFFFLVATRQWKVIRARGNFSDEDACGVAMLATSIIICTFVRSTVISTNDLGWRGIIIAQFVLLIWGAELWVAGLFPAPKTLFSGAGALLALGVATTVYDVTMLRIYPVLLDDLAIPRYEWLARDRNLGERTYALREVYEKLNHELPKDALVQHNPIAIPGDLFYGLYADRQTAAETQKCGVGFGGSAALCPGVLMPIGELFAQSGNLDFGQVDLICRKLSINALVIKDTDAVWNDKSSWAWRNRPLIANGYSRAFLCGAGSEGKGSPEKTGPTLGKSDRSPAAEGQDR